MIKITFFGNAVYVSSALNACQAFDILLVWGFDLPDRRKRAKRKDHRQARVTNGYGFPVFVGGLSCNISGVTSRLFKVCDLEMVLCSLFHLSHSVVIPFNCNEPLRLRSWGHVPVPWEHKAQWCLGVAPSVFSPLRLCTSGMRP